MSTLEPAAVACLERTRSAVLNVLVGAGALVAASGWLLRERDHWDAFRAPGAVRRGLLGGLLLVVFASYGVRRVMGSRSSLRAPEHRATRFFRAHVISAAIGLVALPLGLAYAWLSHGVLNEVAPFWIAAFALGFLALPRAIELADFDAPMPPANEAQPR